MQQKKSPAFLENYFLMMQGYFLYRFSVFRQKHIADTNQKGKQSKLQQKDKGYNEDFLWIHGWRLFLLFDPVHLHPFCQSPIPQENVKNHLMPDA